jgi:hypothetical protein
MKPDRRRSYIRPSGRGFRRSKVKDILNYIIGGLSMLVFAACVAVMVIEWFAGCGETYIDANGERHAYECVFIPQPK